MASICPKCHRALVNPNSWHYCQHKNIDDLFINKPDAVVLVFHKILTEVETWENVNYSATKNCVVFISKKTFLILKPLKACLEVKLFLDEVIEHESVHKIYEQGAKWAVTFLFQDENRVLKDHLSWIRRSYMLCSQ